MSSQDDNLEFLNGDGDNTLDLSVPVIDIVDSPISFTNGWLLNVLLIYANNIFSFVVVVVMR